jgi:hypothetical protein
MEFAGRAVHGGGNPMSDYWGIWIVLITISFCVGYWRGKAREQNRITPLSFGEKEGGSSITLYKNYPKRLARYKARVDKNNRLT